MRWSPLRRAPCAGAVCAVLAVQAAARVADEPPTLTFDPVVVTGSHIRRTDIEGALPVQVIQREEIERSGVGTVEQLLERVAGNVNPVTSAMSVGQILQPGLSAVNLRGLGVGSTLVLLNGRRLANYAFSGESVDLNAIPLAAIERVEVLRDGASALYGADAIGGVVNFILRRDYAGREAMAAADVTQHGGGHAAQAHVAFGRGRPTRDGYNVFGLVSVQGQQALHGSERAATRTSHRPDLGVSGLSFSAHPANIFDRPGRRVLNPAAADGCAPPTSLPATVPAFGTPACGYDFAPAADVLPEVRRASALLRGTATLGREFQAYAEALYARTEFRVDIAPLPIPALGTVFGSPLYPAGGPYYPTEFAAANGLSGDLLIAWRATELGPRRTVTRGEAQRYVVGIDGRAGGWDIDAAALYSGNRQEVEYAGSHLYQSRIVPALRTGLINPWGPSGPEGRALLEAAQYSGIPQRADGTTALLQATAARELVALPAGSAAVALGAEARRERLAYDWDPAVLTGDSPIGNRLKAIAGARTVLAVYSELTVPLARGLEAQAALRHDDYSDAGGTTNPKLALRWQPAHGVLLRGSWGRGFRAPPLYSLNEPVTDAGVTAATPDPVRCPVTGEPDDCAAFVPYTAGGNPGLAPERSTQRSVGAVWEPRPRLSVALDYWQIEQDGVIASPDPFNAASYVRFPARVRRGPADPDRPDLPGPLLGFDASLLNLGSTRTSGFDLAIDGLLVQGPAGALRAALHGTYVRRFDIQGEGIGFVSRLADAREGTPVPRWRSTLTVDWGRGPWGATLVNAWSGGYVEPLPGRVGTRTVGATSTWDLQARWSDGPGWQVALGVRNLFDAEPPFSLTTPFQFGFNPQMASPLGRTFYVRAGIRLD